jgi:hypothetical protein
VQRESLSAAFKADGQPCGEKHRQQSNEDDQL